MSMPPNWSHRDEDAEEISSLSEYLEQVSSPDKYNFKIKDEYYYNGYVLVTINYPDCDNYGGDKSLIYFEEDWKKIKDGDQIDPHFLEKGITPLARFRPSPEGQKLAVNLIKNVL